MTSSTETVYSVAVHDLEKILFAFHEENHAGAFRFCYEAPCRETSKILGDME